MKFSNTRSVRPVRAAAASAASSSASVRVGGFCSETCLPASSAATALLGVQVMWRQDLDRIDAIVRQQFFDARVGAGNPHSAARRRARVSSQSHTATMRAWGWSRYPRHCRSAMRPHPRMPMPIGSCRTCVTTRRAYQDPPRHVHPDQRVIPTGNPSSRRAIRSPDEGASTRWPLRCGRGDDDHCV